MLAKELPCYRKHQVSYMPCKVCCLLTVRVYAVCLFNVPLQVPYLMYKAVHELLWGRGV